MSLGALSARFSSSSTVDPSAIAFDQTWVSFVFAHTIAWISEGRALSGERDGKRMQKAESKCFRAHAKLVLVDGYRALVGQDSLRGGAHAAQVVACDQRAGQDAPQRKVAAVLSLAHSVPHLQHCASTSSGQLSDTAQHDVRKSGVFFSLSLSFQNPGLK